MPGRALRAEPIRFYRLGEEPGADLSAFTTAAERVAMVWALTVDAWTLAGLPVGGGARQDLPVRIVSLRGSDR